MVYGQYNYASQVGCSVSNSFLKDLKAVQVSEMSVSSVSVPEQRLDSGSIMSPWAIHLNQQPVGY